MTIRFGIIGHGFMGHKHGTMLAQLDGIKVAGICDIREDRLEDVMEGVIRYANIDDMLKNPEIDVVLIATNNNQHKELVCKAARAGKDIICEKPVAVSVAELDEMVKTVNECGVKFTVHHQRRYDPDFRTVKEIYDQKLLGDVYTIKTSLYGFNGNMHDWHIFVEEGGGMLYDWGVHLLDQMLWMVDSKIKTVYADLRNVINTEVDDYFKILLRFQNGITAEVELGTYFLSDKENWFERHWIMGGNTGTMYIDGFEPKGKIVRTTRLLTNVPGKATMTAAGPTRSFGEPAPGILVTEELPKVQTKHVDYFENYIRAWHGQEDFLVKIPEVRRVLSLMEAIRKSAITGCNVDFE
ncbi:MAG TPA: Gfo/Idh/MocA family oxidoreductase [Clostridiales bacterium]|nr:Gfo/Idh/MocA family oxidoreductase [Clostridiales bacterium]